MFFSLYAIYLFPFMLYLVKSRKIVTLEDCIPTKNPGFQEDIIIYSVEGGWLTTFNTLIIMIVCYV